MGRIADSDRVRTETFNELQEKSKEMGELNDCGVKAVAVVTGMTYEEAHAALKHLGRINGVGSQRGWITDVIESRGFTVKRIPNEHFISQYPGEKKNDLKNITTHHPARFPEPFAMGVYLMFTKSHVAACVSGVVHDWSIGRSLRVNVMYLITKE